MRVYHVPGTRSGRVVWMLEEIGEPYDVTLLQGEERKDPEHLERHPLGKVPAASDGEGYLFESAGLCLHLADLHPQAGLAPPVGTHARGLLYQWLFFAMTEVEVPLVEVYVQERLRDTPDEAVVAAGRERFSTAAAVVARELADRDYLLESGFSVADIVMGEMLGFAIGMGLTDVDTIVAYRDRLHARPAHIRASAVGRAGAPA